MVKMILFPTFVLGAAALVQVLVSGLTSPGFGIGRGFSYRFGFRFRLRFWVRLWLRRLSEPVKFCFGLGASGRFGIRLRRDGFRLWLNRFNFRFRFVWIHSVPLSSAVRCPSSMWRIRSAYSLMRASWVTIRMQRLFIKNFLFDEGDDHSPGVTIQGGGRFVENQNLRLADDRARNRHALLLAA
jgi:hypothetical protein